MGQGRIKMVHGRSRKTGSTETRQSNPHRPWVLAPGHLGPVVRLDTARAFHLGVCSAKRGLGVAKKLGRHPTLDLALGVSSVGSLLGEGNREAKACALDLRPSHAD